MAVILRVPEHPLHLLDTILVDEIEEILVQAGIQRHGHQVGGDVHVRGKILQGKHVIQVGPVLIHGG